MCFKVGKIIFFKKFYPFIIHLLLNQNVWIHPRMDNDWYEQDRSKDTLTDATTQHINREGNIWFITLGIYEECMGVQSINCRRMYVSDIVIKV